jgi:hypothetical protein
MKKRIRKWFKKMFLELLFDAEVRQEIADAVDYQLNKYVPPPPPPHKYKRFEMHDMDFGDDVSSL